LIISKLRVDGQMFILEPGQDVAGLEQEILEAVRSGAGFVRFETVGRGLVSVLITPKIGVRFESLERTEQEIAEWELDPPPIDIDSDFAGL
jgi:hypothetical protein